MTTSAPGLREIKKQETRELIARTGVRLFVEQGFDAVSVADIADAAHVSKVTVFNYFPAKEDIFLFSAANGLPDFATAIENVRSDSQLVRAVREYVMDAFASRAEWSGLHENADVYARVIDASPTLVRAMQAAWARRREEFVSVAANRLAYGATGEGELESGLQRVFAAQIFAAVEELTDFNRGLMRGEQDADQLIAISLRCVERVFSRIMASIPTTGSD